MVKPGPDSAFHANVRRLDNEGVVVLFAVELGMIGNWSEKGEASPWQLVKEHRKSTRKMK